MVEGEEYEGTPGLWELIVSKKPDKFIYTSEDEENYRRLMLKTNSLYVGNNPERKKKVVRVINGIIYLVNFGKI